MPFVVKSEWLSMVMSGKPQLIVVLGPRHCNGQLLVIQSRCLPLLVNGKSNPRRPVLGGRFLEVLGGEKATLQGRQVFIDIR